MLTSAYERSIYGHSANENLRPPQPNVIKLAIRAIGRENYRYELRGHYIWADGRWNGPLKLPEFIREANMRLKARGVPQIAANPAWVISDSEVADVNP
jgi:hypothetical protein